VDRFTEPEDESLDKFIYSATKLIGPYSFMNEAVLVKNIIANVPPPTYEKYSKLIIKHSLNK
jgi:hypothetical protein